MSSTSNPHEVVKKRWLGFLIWQAIASTIIFLFKSLLFPFSRPFSASSILSFLAFKLSLLLLSLSLFFILSPCHGKSASFIELSAEFFRFFLRIVVGGTANSNYSAEFLHRAGRTLSKGFFLVVCGISGFISIAAVCGRVVSGGGLKLVGLGIIGAMFGFIYGICYLYRQRWILTFPIIQRPFFYSIKMGLYSSFKEALKLSALALFLSLLVMPFIPEQFMIRKSIGTFILLLFNLYAGVAVIFFTWELSTHLLWVVHTRRCHFAPSRGSAAAETNPSEGLLEALEQSSPKSLLKHLAYLDLCMISEINVEPWRRAAFFEETGETYRRVISLCLRPLEHLTSRLVEGLEGLTIDKSDFFSEQLNPSTGTNIDSNLHVVFNDFQRLYSSNH